MAAKAENEVLTRLDLLVRLQALGLISRFESLKDKIVFLGAAGMQPKEIADLLQTTANHVSVTLSKERKNRQTSP